MNYTTMILKRCNANRTANMPATNWKLLLFISVIATNFCSSFSQNVKVPCVEAELDSCSCTYFNNTTTRVECRSTNHTISIFQNIPPTITELVLTGHNFTVLPYGLFGPCNNGSGRFSKLNYLDLSYNNIHEIENNAFMCLTFVRILLLDHNFLKVKENASDILTGLDSLVTLQLVWAFEAYDGQKFIGVDLKTFFNSSGLIHLQHLNMMYNQFVGFNTQVLASLPSLLSLNLPNSRIRNLIFNAEDVPSLQILNLANNSLMFLSPHCLDQLHHHWLKHPGFKIELLHNEFVCDCKMRSMWSWLQVNNSDFVSLKNSSLVCLRPEHLHGRLIENLTSEEMPPHCPPQPLTQPAEVTAVTVIIAIVFVIFVLVFVALIYKNWPALHRRFRRERAMRNYTPVGYI